MLPHAFIHVILVYLFYGTGSGKRLTWGGKVGPGKLTYIVNVPDIVNMQNHEPDPAYRNLFLYLKSGNPTGPISSGTVLWLLVHCSGRAGPECLLQSLKYLAPCCKSLLPSALNPYQIMFIGNKLYFKTIDYSFPMLILFICNV